MNIIGKIVAVLLALVGLFFCVPGFAALSSTDDRAGTIIMIIIGLLFLAAAVWLFTKSKTSKSGIAPVSIEKRIEKIPNARTMKDSIVADVHPDPQQKDVGAQSAGEVIEYQISDELYHKALAQLDATVDAAMQITDLTPQELAVMYKLGNHPIGHSREYWLSVAGVDTIEAAHHYLDFGYATYQPLDPGDLTVVELKDLLRAKEAKLSGVKDDLIDRVLDVYSTEELITLNPEKKILLTEKGVSAMNATPYTVLRNHVIEHDCLALIIKGDYESAHKKVAVYLGGRRDQDYPVIRERFDRIQQMQSFNDPVKDAIYNAMQILEYLVTGNEQTPMIYIESWIPGYHGTDKETNERIDAEFIRVMEGYKQ